MIILSKGCSDLYPTKVLELINVLDIQIQFKYKTSILPFSVIFFTRWGFFKFEDQYNYSNNNPFYKSCLEIPLIIKLVNFIPFDIICLYQ